jgi:hypothetical protein
MRAVAFFVDYERMRPTPVTYQCEAQTVVEPDRRLYTVTGMI